MIPIQDIYDRSIGSPAVILGGGPNLAKDLETTPKDAIRISANHHGLALVHCDYVVFLDAPELHRALYYAIQGFDGLKLSRRLDWSDFDLDREFRHFPGELSGHLAAWLGCWLGCDPVLLCGMDLYQERQANLLTNINGWRRAIERFRNPQRVKALSGPLTKIFK